MMEAILMFSPQSSLLAKSSRVIKAEYHKILQILALFCSVGGFLVIYSNKNLHNKKHFTSFHGLLGLITMILVLIQNFSGTFITYSKWLLPKNVKLAKVKLLHALMGSLVFMSACTTFYLGLCSNWFVKNSNTYTWYGSAFSILALGGIVLGQVFNEHVKRRAAAQ